jgi:hypothetical protein
MNVIKTVLGMMTQEDGCVRQVLFMKSVAFFVVLSVIMLSVVVLNVVEPI